MAPKAAAPAAGKPKRKRQRRRRDVSSDDDSSSSSDSSSEEETAPAPVKLPTPEASSSESESSSSSSESESSEDDRRTRRGRGAAAAAAANANASTSTARRPYPSRSPSPQVLDPANLPLGQSPFPMLKELGLGPILAGQVPGDEGYIAVKPEEAETEEERKREDKFGAWWRARLVSEFETDLGGLAAEPGLTPPRLALLLSSLTSLSTLHTTSSGKAAAAKSIWLHDPAAAIDPLAALNVEESAEEWGKAPVGGKGDVEVGEEGISADGAKPVEGSGMDVDE